MTALNFFSFTAVDGAFSRFLSGRTPAPVVLEGVRWKPLAGIRFEHFSSGGARGKGWISSRGLIYFSELSFSPGFLRSLPSLSLEGLSSDGKALQFNEAIFQWEAHGASRRLRIVRLRSGLVELRGAVCWAGGRLEKASLAALLSAELAERLPNSVRRHLSAASGGKKILKCAFKNNRLTFYGASGPLLQASWSPD